MYGSVQKMIDRFGEGLMIDLTDRSEQPLNAVASAAITTALSDASSIVDGYLAGRYSLPLSNVPPLVVTLAEDIALYRLYTFDRPEKVATDHKDAMAVLRDIAKGVIRLPADVSGPAPVSTSGAKVLSGDEPYTTADFKGFI